jgi:hypothetical protein
MTNSATALILAEMQKITWKSSDMKQPDENPGLVGVIKLSGFTENAELKGLPHQIRFLKIDIGLGNNIIFIWFY